MEVMRLIYIFARSVRVYVKYTFLTIINFYFFILQKYWDRITDIKHNHALFPVHKYCIAVASVYLLSVSFHPRLANFEIFNINKYHD